MQDDPTAVTIESEPDHRWRLEASSLRRRRRVDVLCDIVRQRRDHLRRVAFCVRRDQPRDERELDVAAVRGDVFFDPDPVRRVHQLVVDERRRDGVVRTCVVRRDGIGLLDAAAASLREDEGVVRVFVQACTRWC